MSTLAEKLKRRRREEQEIRGYANSSRWYTGLSNAISFLERAETGTDPLNRFSDAWSVAYNLFMMHGEPGDEEYRRFNSWVSTLKDYAGVRHYFVNTGDPLIASFRQSVERVKKILLKADGLQSLESWATKGVSPEKTSRYFFLMIRDMRNTAFHPEFNPNTAPVKKALAAAADCLIPIVAAAVDATIEHPVPNTTGRATAYRFFLYPFLKNSDGFFSDYYLERLFPDEELSAFPEDQAKELLKQIAKSLDTKEPGLSTADAQETVTNWLNPVLFEALGAKPAPGVRIIAEEAVFQPSFVLLKAGTSPKDEHGDMRGKAAGKALSCLIWTLPWKASLDSVATEPPFMALPVTEVVHRALAASDVPWAIITNGRQLRLLSRASSHKPRCFLEADLVALVDRKADKQALRAFRFVLGLFSARCFTEVDHAGHSLLDRVAEGSDRHGKEIGDELKGNVFSALEELGEGFLAYMRAAPKATDEWKDLKAPKLSRGAFLASDTLLEDIYHESLSMMYRLLFLFYAESRELLPLDNELYQTYSLESIRDEVHSILDDPDKGKRFFAKGNTDLWNRLKELFGFLDKGWGKVIPPYNGGLFDPDEHVFLERFAVGDYYLARAIDLLSRTKPQFGQNRGEGRKKVTYRDLDVRNLGSIYEGILEYNAHIADQEYVILRQGSGTGATEEYKAVAELDRAEKAQLAAWREAVDENPESPHLPRGCRVSGHVEQGRYYLVFGGRQSKRKSSGSYYTPDYIVQYIVEHALGPLVKGHCRLNSESITEELRAIGWKDEPQKVGPLSSEEILSLRILDPAMGSGHFLVAATEYLARAYRDALLAEGVIPDEAKADQEFIRYKRIIAERCIYGVDLNSMAVELAKLSMWLFTMDGGRPLSFLDHHLKCGNALIGAWLRDLGVNPASFRATASSGAQENLFEAEFKKHLPPMIRDILRITSTETLTYTDIADKKHWDTVIEDTKRPFCNVANAWLSTFVGENTPDYFSLLLSPESARDLRMDAAETDRYFHWEIEFPDLFFDGHATRLTNPGFDAVIGNPPYLVEARNNAELFRHIKQYPYLSARYEKNVDLYVFFVHRALDVTRVGGLQAYIVPNYILSRSAGTQLRERMSECSSFRILLDFGTFPVFAEAPGHHSCIYVLRVGQHEESSRVRYQVLDPISGPTYQDRLAQVRARLSSDAHYEEVSIELSSGKFVILTGTAASVMGRLSASQGIRYPEDLIVRGVDTSPSDVDGKGVFVLSEAERTSLWPRLNARERGVLKPFFLPRQFDRFGFERKNNYWLLYTDKKTRTEMEDDPKVYPSLVAHLKSFAAHITSDNAPFGLHRPKALNVFENRRKIVMVRKTPYPKFALVPDQCFVDEGCYILLPLQTGPTEEFFCGVFNSSIAHFWFRMHKTQGGQLQIDKEILLSLPIVVRPSRTVTAGADMTVGELLQRHAKLSDENDRWNLCREVIIHCVRRLTKSFTATDYELCDAAVGLMYGFGLKELADVRKLLEGEA